MDMNDIVINKPLTVAKFALEASSSFRPFQFVSVLNMYWELSAILAFALLGMIAEDEIMESIEVWAFVTILIAFESIVSRS